jgi:uncharacterized protein (TIGR03437 family)
MKSRRVPPCFGGLSLDTFRATFLAALLAQSCFPASLAISTYFKDGFTPSAIASDAQGNTIVAGSAVVDPASQTFGAAVAKLDPKASQFLYLTYLDSAANDKISAIAMDPAGNAYVTGYTINPNFPAVGGGSLGTASTGMLDPRSFVTKLSPDGGVLFSVLIGGSASSQALGVAIAPQGQILISGLAGSSGFPATPGTYSVSDSKGQWFLMELNPSATTVIFSATGIGGSSIAFDSASNIYLAGSSAGTGYPTTPGTYQTTFVQGHVCGGLCQIGSNGGLQHITKVDPAATKLIYSTGLNDLTGAAGNTSNTGLAVDAAGDVFVTGTLLEAGYPFTVPAPGTNYGYLSKLDPAGSSLLFSVPLGGGGVALDTSGSVYVGGIVSSYNPTFVPPTTPVAPPAIFSWIPQPCWPDSIAAFNEVYVMKLDPATGTPLDAQWIDGSAPTAVGIALAGGNVWITGGTPAPDTPFTPGTLSPKNLGTGFTPGAYLAAVDFTASAPAGTPAIACVLDAANLEHVRAVAGYQAISLFGVNLGPSTGVAAPDGTDPSIAGVTVTFGGNLAPLLYVSSSQIDVEVPPNASPVMQVTVNGQSSSPREFPLAASNLNVFANLASNEIPCSPPAFIANGFQPLAMNADGSINSCTNPAKPGATVSFYVDGIGAQAGGTPPTALPLELQASIGPCFAPVLNTNLIDGFVYQVDVQVPASPNPCAGVINPAVAALGVTFSYKGVPVGPLVVPYPPNGPILNFTPGQPMPMIVWAVP